MRKLGVSVGGIAEQLIYGHGIECAVTANGANPTCRYDLVSVIPRDFNKADITLIACHFSQTLLN